MYFTCAKHGPATDHGAANRNSGGGKSGKSIVVDIHCHRQSMTAGETMKSHAEAKGQPAALGFGNDLTREVNKRQLESVAIKMTSLDERFADMDAAGIDIQAISVPPYQFYYWADAEVARETVRLINDEMAEIAADHPDRIVAMGTVPLQNTEMAVAELERCVGELGMRAIAIGTNVGGKEISNPGLDPFYAKVEELDVLIFIHPDTFTHGERLREHYFINLIGNPLESTIAVSHLIFDGVLARYPGLKFCVAHGGGYLPAYAGRLDHGYHARADCHTVIDRPPTEYLEKFYFDTMVFEPDQLAFLIEKYGADHILLGTDFPYDMGDTDPVGLVERVPGLGAGDRDRVCGLNAAELLKISV